MTLLSAPRPLNLLQTSNLLHLSLFSDLHKNFGESSIAVYKYLSGNWLLNTQFTNAKVRQMTRSYASFVHI